MANGLSISNATPRRLPGPQLLHELVPRHGKNDAPAIEHTTENGSTTTLTYSDFHDKASALARCITSMVDLSTTKRQRFIVPVLIPQGPDLYISQLAILKAGGAFCPIVLDVPEERLRFILQDVDASILLTTAASRTNLPDLGNVQVLSVDEESMEGQHNDSNHPVTSTDPAYIMYTSGSTGQPKGVVLSHSAATQALLAHDLHIPSFQRFLQFASPTFDVSVFEIFFPWLRGSTLVSCDRRRMLNDLPATINDLNVDACELTPSVASSLLRGRKSVPSLKVLLTIGEMLKPSVVQDFGGDDAQSAILHGMYGPTEATIHCTLQTNFPKSMSCGSIGVPLETVSAFVVKPVEENGRKKGSAPEILPIGEEGELAVGGYQLADGYLNREEQTKAAFVRHHQHGTLYRTGDRARMLPNGTFECLGRISSGQIKLRGQRIELGEIEHAVSRTPGCRDAVVEVIGGILVAFCVSGEEPIRTTDVLSTCRDWLPSFMVPGDIVLLDSLPYLASGKCDRKSLRAHYEEKQASQEFDGNSSSPHINDVISAIQNVLRVEVNPKSSLPGLGMDSLSSIRIASEMTKRGLPRVDAGQLLSARTPVDVCTLLDRSISPGSESSAERNAEAEYKPALEKVLQHSLSAESWPQVEDYFPCTAVQAAMLAETAKDAQAYCNWIEFAVSPSTDTSALRTAIYKLSEIHPLLRAGFLATSGSNWTHINVIWKSLVADQISEVSAFDYDFKIDSDRSLLRPLHFQLVQGEDGCRLLLQAHHALFDQWAVDIFRTDLAALLTNRPSREPASFKAVSNYHIAQQQSMDPSTALEFWQEHLRDVTASTIPLLRGQHIEHGLERTSWRETRLETSTIRASSRALGCSSPAIFQAALALLLGAYIGTSDVTFGTVLSGRTIPVQGIDTVFGPCLATLPTRIDSRTTRTCRDLLRTVTSCNRSMQENLLVSPTTIRQAAGISPGTSLFDTLFVWQESTLDAQGYSDTVAIVDSRDNLEFNLVLEFEPSPTKIRARAIYQRALLDSQQVDSLLDEIDYIAAVLTSETECAVSEIATHLPNTALSISNPDPVSCATTFELTSVIEQRAHDDPNSTAIIFASNLEASPPVTESILYSELDSRANRMARHFLAAGVKPQSLVCICMEKCIDLYVAMLASFKCGAGYLPLVPETPDARVKSIIAQVHVSLCVCDADTAPRLRNLSNASVVDLSNATLPGETSSPSIEQIGSRTSYAVFTSGSTGEPKGVAVSMDNLKGNLAVLGELYRVSAGDRLLQSCSQAFDVSVFEIFFAFYSGMCLCSATKEVMFRDFEKSIRALRATHLSLTPTVASLASPQNVPDVRFLVTAGEGVTEKVHRTWAGHGLHQGYGPSETTNICSVKMNVSTHDVLGNIGPPFRNTSAFVIAPEDDFRILPKGAYGEFAFGGEQVFRGYMGLDTLNAEKIITHPKYGRVYRSGDMGRILANGTLLISGRLDDQVKIRGNRVELGEINTLVSDCAGVIDCTTLLIGEKSSNQTLATFWVPSTLSESRESSSLAISAADQTQQIFNRLEDSLPAYMIPSIVVPLTSLPATSQGKRDKRRLRTIIDELDPSMKDKFSRSFGESNDDPPSSTTEHTMAKLLAGVLDVQISNISRNASFFSLGLNSLNAIQYAKALEQKLNSRVSISSILRHSSIARLSALISDSSEKPGPEKSINVRQILPSVTVEEVCGSYAGRGYDVDVVLPCTPLQEAMLSASGRGSSNTYFNTIKLTVDGDIQKIRDCWHEITRRHAILRTSFMETTIAEYPYVQVVIRDPHSSWYSRDLEPVKPRTNGYANGLSNGHGHDPRSISASPISAQEPLRVVENGQTLYLQMHHALYDGIAVSNLFAEMRKLYQGEMLPPAVSFEPFLAEVLAQNGKDAIDFWSHQMMGFKSHPFPPSGDSADYKEKTHVLSLPLSPAELESFSERHASTSLAVFQAAWVKTLACAQGISDLCFGNVVSGRSVTLKDIDRLVAPCFNTIPIRIRLEAHQTNLDLVRHLHCTNVQCSPYQLTGSRRIQSLSKTPANNLFDSLLLVQPPNREADTWDAEEEDMDMGIPIVMEIIPLADTFELQVHYLPARIPDEIVSYLVCAFIGSLTACVKYPASSFDYLGGFDSNKLASRLSPTSSRGLEANGKGNDSDNDEPWSPGEKMVRAAFSELAGIHDSRISKQTSLYQIGLDSLNAVQVASKLRKAGLKIGAADIMQYQTPSALAAFLANANKEQTTEQSGSIDLTAFEMKERASLVRSLQLDDRYLESVRPCTSAQSGMLAQFIQSRGVYYFNHSVFEIPAKITIDAIKSAWKAVQRRHQVLRMGFAQIDNAELPFAMIIYRPDSYMESVYLDSQDLDDEAVESMASEKVFDALHLPAWRLSFSTSKDARRMRLSLHHALYDADSLQILLCDFAKALKGVTLGSAQDIDSLLQMQLDGAMRLKDAQKGFWKSALQSSRLVKFPNLTPTIVEQPQSSTIQASLDVQLSQIESFCRREGVTIQALGQSVWALLLAAYFGEPDVTFGTVFAGASPNARRAAAFPTISTLPVYCNTQKSAIDVIKDMVSYNSSAQRHRFSSLSDIQRFAGSAGQALFDTIFIYQKAPGSDGPTLEWKSLSDNLGIDYAVSLELEHTNDSKLQLRLSYDRRTVPDSHAVLILKQYDMLMKRIVDGQYEREAETTSLMSVVPAKESTLPCGVDLLHEFVERGARDHPHKPALEFIYSLESNEKARKTWTYQDLENRSNQVAQLIYQRGIKPGCTIAVCMTKCAEATFAFVGILKAGCAFLAMDPDLPLARRQFIAEDSQSQLLFVNDGKASEEMEQVVQTVELTEVSLTEYPSTPVAVPTIDPQSTSYCLYTSGTTGNPKGCELTHENAVQAMMSFQRLFAGHWTESSRWLQFASYWFDVSVLEQFWSWSVGVTVVGAPRDVVLEDLPGFIRAANITHIDLTPSLARLLKPEDVPSLHNHVFITGGEALKQEIIDSWGPLHTIYNGYGPTEATIGVTMNPHIGPDAKPSNIGPPFDNVGAYVFAPGTDEVVMRGAVGELCVSGKLVGKGYLNRPDLTAKSFPYLERHGERVYRTGDLVRLLADDSVSFIGRQDTQAKLRGQRLEIDEIDAVIKQSTSAIADVASLVVKSSEGNREILVSFIVVSESRSRSLDVVNSQSTGDLIGTADRACRDHLPGYMVPTHTIPVTRIPLTVNNKVDAKALLALFTSMSTKELQALKGSQSDTRSLAPTERKVAKVLARLLAIDVDDIATGSNIFSLGLSSVSAINFTSMLKRSGFKNASVAIVMNNLTVESLALALANESDANREERSAVMQAQLSISAFAQRHRSTAAKALDIDVSDIGTMAPCTPLQEGLLVESLKSTRKPYFNHFCYELHKVNIQRLREAVLRLYSLLPILRTAFLDTDDGFGQVLVRSRRCPLEVITLGNGDVDGLLMRRRNEWQLKADQDVLTPFEVIIVQTPSDSFLSIFAHHALYDGISWDLMMDRLAQIYNTSSDVDCGPDFIDVLPYGPLCRRKDAKDYWQSRMEGFHYTPLVALDETPAEHDVHLHKTVRDLESFEDVRRRTGVSHQAVLQAAFTVALHQLAPNTQCYGMVLSGRSIGFEKAEKVIGPLFNTVPSVIDVQPTDTWDQYLKRCHQSSVTSLPFQHTPLREIRKFCDRNPADPMFDVLFVFQRPETSESASEALFEPAETEVAAEYPLAMEVELGISGDIQVTAVARSGYASNSSLQLLVQSLENALKDLISNPQALISDRFTISNSSVAGTPQISGQDMTMLDGVLDFAWTENALKLRNIIAQVVGCEAELVTEHVAIYTLGLDSIDAVKLASRMKRAGLRIPVSKLLQAQTIPRILDAIETAEKEPAAEQQSKLLALERQLQDFLPAIQTDVERILPATPGQEALLADMIRSGFRDYYNSDILKLQRGIDLQRFKDAWQTVVDASPILRTSFVEITDPESDTVYAQAVHRRSPLHFDEIQAEDIAKLSVYIDGARMDVRATFALKSPLRLAFVTIGQEQYFILSLAHAQYDGHSLSLLHSDVSRAYHGSFKARPLYDEPIELALNSTNEDSKSFWRNALSGTKPSRFPDGGKVAVSATYHAERTSAVPAQDARNACKRFGVSLPALTQAAWALTLAHYEHELEVTFGVVLACRESEEAEQVLFPTMNTIPIRAALHGTGQEMIQYLQGVINEMRPFQRTPLRFIQAAASQVVDKSRTANGGLFDTLFIFQNRGDGDMQQAALYESVGGEANIEYPVAVEAEAVGNDLIISASCKSSALDQRGTHELVKRFDHVLDQLVHCPDQPTISFPDDSVSICGLPSFPLQAGSLPRQTTREPQISEDSDGESDAESSVIDSIRSAFAQVSKVAPSEISSNTTLESIGIDSISAIKVAAILRKESIKLPVSEILKAQTPKCMAALVADESASKTENGVSSRDAIDAATSDSDIKNLCQAAGIEEQNIERVLPATAGQDYMLSMWQKSRGELFFPTFRYQMKTEIDIVRLCEAWNQLLARNPILRTVFINQQDSNMPLLQLVLKNVSSSFSETKEQTWTNTQPLVHLSASRTQDGFDLALKIQHSLYDAISLPLLVQQLEDLIEGGGSSLPNVNFEDYIALAHDSETRKASESFWKQYLSELRPRHLTQPQSDATKKVQIFQAAAFTSGKELEQRARATGVTVQALLFATYAKAYASRAEGPSEDVVLGIYLANRSHLSELDQLAAPTLNLLPLKVQNPTKTDVIKTAKQIDIGLRNIGTKQNSMASLRDMYAWTGVRLDTFVNFLKLPNEEEEDATLKMIQMKDEWTQDVSRVIEPDIPEAFEMPQGLQDFEAGEAYLHAVDVEFSMNEDGRLSFGLFAKEDTIGLEEGEKIIKEIVRDLEAVSRSG